MNKIIFNIKGMHCRSCEILIEDELLKVAGIKKVNVSQKKGTAEIYYKNKTIDNSIIKQAVQNAGYEIGQNEKKSLISKDPNTYKNVVLSVIILVFLILVIDEFGLFNWNTNFKGNYHNLTLVFLIGLTAGVSTCMALVGGLVLAASSRFAEKNPQATTIEKFKPHLFFNLGRIISFFFLGGLIGYAGSLLQLSPGISGVLTIFVGIVMIILGFQLTGIFPMLDKIKLTIPKSVFRLLGRQKSKNNEYTNTNTILAGALTFFLPCGFTQAIQLFAINSGSIMTGALTMLIFALGTTPGLIGLGGLTSAVKGAFAQWFFKFTGIIVIFMAFFNIRNGYNLAGVNNLFIKNNIMLQKQINDPNVTIKNRVQIVKMNQTTNGYDPNLFTIKKNIPVKWIINSQDSYSCTASIVSGQIGVRKNLLAGENIIEFTPYTEGQIVFSCGMGMYKGVFNVVKN